MPHKGWICVDIEDLEEPSATCEMCEAVSIRYVHHMQHPSYSEMLGCGCVCAGHMEGDYANAERREKVLRNSAARRRKWLSRAWRTSRSGNPYLNAEGYNVVVYPAGAGWGFRVSNRQTKDGVASRRILPSMDAAKLRAFDAVVQLKDQGR